jgi:uncharacterized protein
MSTKKSVARRLVKRKKVAAAVTKKTAVSLRAPTTSPWMEVRESPIHGRGIYASRDIPSGTKIIEYQGERITKAESERRDAARAARGAAGGDGCVYVFEVNKRYDLDGYMDWNTARLINHSCEPNCKSENLRGHIWIVAYRDIVAGEELSFDYGFDVANWQDHRCLCGSPKCVGYIVAKSHRWRLRKRLAKLRRVKKVK